MSQTIKQIAAFALFLFASVAGATGYGGGTTTVTATSYADAGAYAPYGSVSTTVAGSTYIDASTSSRHGFSTDSLSSAAFFATAEGYGSSSVWGGAHTEMTASRGELTNSGAAAAQAVGGHYYGSNYTAAGVWGVGEVNLDRYNVDANASFVYDANAEGYGFSSVVGMGGAEITFSGRRGGYNYGH